MEFDRKALKARGKERFQERYWLMVGVTAIFVAISGAAGSFSGFFSELGALPGAIIENPGWFIAGASLGSVLTTAIAILILGPLECAIDYIFYRRYIGEEIKVTDLFASFKEKTLWVRSMVTVLLVSVFTFLWSLLFVVPGIIKAISYSMAPYIIMDDPSLSPKQAIEKSKEMTNGYKGKIFVMELSFIGWMMLSALTCGVVGIFWAIPYISTSMAGIYDLLKSASEGQVIVDTSYTPNI